MATVIQKKIEAVEALLKLGQEYNLRTMDTEFGVFEFAPTYAVVEEPVAQAPSDPYDDPVYDAVRRR